ncbi:bifunctional riboflavin kinase/FAD synthetase [Leptospira bourretii]|uniref:Riboflavin biosynthesis protein n=1 Tax=Leptospira bourretii TaxID=2484962 RepID=A0A4R9INH5_9LEPT|nr:bifunctional riboflavin kinase/FAD synthetase [Leptospira bourretii]TGK89415.1 bifunctional riboflavin kinase/FAD synthetase [Leptospira bourretii]TGK93417.1 bifunctional riboflavin kinase/FAD synthetase [Leptospira bourretii]TGL18350.1 bifunctional riboflavin kinase/FAD synthetase [Leptospira bourretii]TGL36278.1 bifunctional riboflavin kinase/FAD synthetase [Leptospira bourretii]
MKIIRSLESIQNEFQNGSSLTLGNFDGIHVGHQTLLLRTVEKAKDLGLPSVVVTYFPNPSVVLGKKPNFKYLSSESEKEELIRGFGIDYLVVLDFTLELSKMSAEVFLEKIMIQTLNAKHIVIGYNHFFGAERRGDFTLLDSNKTKYGYAVELKEAVLKKESKISSSLIRGFLEKGEMEEAKILLGRNYHITGVVFEGAKRGRTIGFPTANIKVPEDKLLPAIGVYACFAKFDGHDHKGMVNIGHNPTFDGLGLHVEVNVFDFDGNLYGKEVELEIVHKIRDEKKFGGLEELKNQLTKDKEDSIRILDFN